ncbi:hypothetical protein ONE63_001683 [Megalurothrips usitatus]|uniref:Peptidase S1 domain-containing protein n=1 Tax=Megalurothrips usitatus TaxID=439358 RepID=A0AAV7XBF7_9NEOP|nr:hypothetical protein ONE63_001683 [Megalurothrips usitatus]
MIGICVLAEYTRVPGVLSTMPSADFLNNEFCAADSSAEGTALGAAYSVISAEGKWVVRGLRAMDWVSSNNGTVRVFYNLDTPPIREWLDDKAQVGTANETTADASNVAELSPNKPPTPPSPCGETKLPLFRLLSDSETLAGPLPWSVAIQVDGKEQLNSGVLVRRDIVLTDASLLTTPQFVANDTGTVHTVNPDQVRVVWVSSSGRRRMAEVLAVHAHEREYGPLDQVGATPAFDVALLRLKTPFTDSEVAVACLDQEKLPKLERYQVGLTDAWEISLLGFQSNVQGSMHVDVMGMYCAFKNSAFTTDVMTPSAFCTGPMKEQVRSGAGFLVRKGGSWFVNGIVSYHITNFVSYESKNSWVVTNLDEEGVKDWIHQKLEAEAPDTTPRRTQASEPIECGQTTLALSSLAENETLARSMPWSAIIYGRGLNGSVTSMVPGVLVRPDMVLTGNENATYIMDPSHTFVVWIRPNGRKQRSSVRSVHPHGRPRGSPGFDLVLLRLKEPFLDTSVACVDIETPSAELDRKGVMEPWSFLPNPKERLCKEKRKCNYL